MPPALAPITPQQLHDILIAAKFVVVNEDDMNWALARSDTDEPIILPKLGELVAVEVLMDTVFKSGLGLKAYLALRKRFVPEVGD